MPAWKHRNRTIPVVSELEQSTCNHPASLLNRDFAPSSPCMAAQHWRTTRQIGMPCGLHGSPDPPRWSPTRAMRRMLVACAASSGCFGSRFLPASVRRSACFCHISSKLLMLHRRPAQCPPQARGQMCWRTWPGIPEHPHQWSVPALQILHTALNTSATRCLKE